MKVTQTIERYGGPSKVAKLLGQKLTTVQYWFYKDHIPVWRRHLLEQLVAEHEPIATPKKRAVDRRKAA